MAATRKNSVESRERAVRLYRESNPKPVIAQLARQLGVHPEAGRGFARMRPTAVSARTGPRPR